MSAGQRLRAIGGILAAFVVFELILRQLYWGLPTFKPEAGWGHFDTELRRYYFEGGSSSHWDARGVRRIPGSVPRGPALLAVGNSVTQATQVVDDQVFTALVQRRTQLPVLNVGHDAQSLADDVISARYRLDTFNPAWSIIQFIPLDFEERPARINKAHFILVDGRLVAEPGVVRLGRFRRAQRASALVNMGLLRYAVLRETPMPPLFRAADPRPETPRRYGPIELKLDVLRDAYRGRVTMFMVPEFLGEETIAEKRFTEWCRRSDASCVNFRAVFDDFRRRGRAPTGFPNSRFGYGHLNPEGHAAAAGLLSTEIERLRARDLF